MPNQPDISIQSVQNLVFGQPFSIPSYQRPYKWSAKNVNQLLDDIILHSDKTAYRIGTIVLYRDKGENKKAIVDGQQRLLTLSLIAYELSLTELGKKLVPYAASKLSIAQMELVNVLTNENLKKNQNLIKSRIKELAKHDIIKFFFDKCEMVSIELDDISEAFQFFDSQNTRGKDLEPHDLLKAFHLREMRDEPEKMQQECVAKWEEIADNLSPIFENHLFKIRQWTKGRSGLYFSKDKIDTFKGITFGQTPNYQFVMPYRINHYYTENHNSDTSRKIDQQLMDYPFQIDQVMINGRRFFEYTHFYAKKIKSIEKAFHDNPEIRKKSICYSTNEEMNFSNNIIKTLRTYGGRHRTGDQYVKNLFDCCLLHYLDKFGTYKLDEAVKSFFIWAYSIRLERQAVQNVTVDNAGRTHSSFFRVIRESNHVKDIIHRSLPPANYVGKDKAVQNIEPIVTLFRDFNSLIE